jgi:hypothetical protein
MPAGSPPNRTQHVASSRLSIWVPFLVCALLAIVHTWPLATAPHILSRHDNGDVMLNEWILAWVQHQLPRDPLHLFQGNIFYPARDTLAYSEPLIVPALMAAPVRGLGGSPVLVHNLLVMAGFALTALAAYAVIKAWTGDGLAAFVAASAFAFNTHLLVRLAHVQALHAYGLPLALLATDRLLIHHRTRDALWLALWMTVMAYTSGYYFIFGTVMIAVALLARSRDWVRRPRAVLPRFAVAAALTGAAVFPVYLPYHRVAREQGLVRSLENVSDYSATLTGYLAAAGRLHYATWSAPLFKNDVDAFFPGVTVLALSVAAVVLVWRTRSTGGDAMRRVIMLVAIAVVGIVLSLGTRTPVYGWLYAVFPPLAGIRAAARFGNLFLLAMALLAGLGTALLRSSGTFGRHAKAFTIALVVLVNAEAVRAPFQYRRFDGIPNLYSILAREPGRVVLVEQPFYPPQGVFENAEYVLNSTAHWRPLMNGYSGYTPLSYRQFAESFWFFPREHAIDAMRRAGVTHVMVHPHRFERDAPAMKRMIDASPFLERLAIGRDEITLYRLH